MKNRTIILLTLCLLVAALAVWRNFFYLGDLHPDSLDAFRHGLGTYERVVQDGEASGERYTHRLRNGLLIYVEKREAGGFEPKLGIYRNPDGAEVHVEVFDGIVHAHTHGHIPAYELGAGSSEGIEYIVRQIPPEHYDRGPSRFVIRYAAPVPEARPLHALIQADGKAFTESVQATRLSIRNWLLEFKHAFPEYPENARLVVSADPDAQSERFEFEIHPLPPRETLHRSLVN